MKRFLPLAVIAIAASAPSGESAQMPPIAQPPPTEIDLCRRQLATAHDAADASERQIFLANANLATAHADTAAMEARLTTALEWLKQAQEANPPKQ